MDIAKAFEAENGFTVSTDNEDGPFYTGGASSPVGLDLPTRTIYVQTNPSSKVIIWQKFSTGINDWRQLSAQDIPFDATNAQNVTDTDMQSLGETLSNRNFGKDFDASLKTADETTTGSSFTVYSSLTFDVTAESTPNIYRINANFVWGHNSASNDIRVQLLLDGVQVGEELRQEPKDAGADQRYYSNILGPGLNLTAGSHTIDLQYRPATASRVSRMFQASLEVWRVL